MTTTHYTTINPSTGATSDETMTAERAWYRAEALRIAAARSWRDGADAGDAAQCGHDATEALRVGDLEAAVDHARAACRIERRNNYGWDADTATAWGPLLAFLDALCECIPEGLDRDEYGL